MDRLQIKVTYCKCQEYERRLKEQFTNGLDNETIIAEIIKELTDLNDTCDISSEQVLKWVQTVETQRVQKAVFGNIRDTKKLT